MKFYTGSIPAKPLRVTVRYTSNEVINFGDNGYTSVQVVITDPDGVPAVDWTGPLTGLVDDSALVIPWSTLSASATTFAVPGDYTAQLTLIGPGIVDITDTATIEVYRKEGA